MLSSQQCICTPHWKEMWVTSSLHYKFANTLFIVKLVALTIPTLLISWNVFMILGLKYCMNRNLTVASSCNQKFSSGSTMHTIITKITYGHWVKEKGKTIRKTGNFLAQCSHSQVATKEDIGNDHEIQEIRIYSDNHADLQATLILRTYSNPKLYACTKIKAVKLKKIPGHRCVERNERADQLAKHGSSRLLWGSNWGKSKRVVRASAHGKDSVVMDPEVSWRYGKDMMLSPSGSYTGCATGDKGHDGSPNGPLQAVESSALSIYRGQAYLPKLLGSGRNVIRRLVYMR